MLLFATKLRCTTTTAIIYYLLHIYIAIWLAIQDLCLGICEIKFVHCLGHKTQKAHNTTGIVIYYNDFQDKVQKSQHCTLCVTNVI